MVVVGIGGELVFEAESFREDNLAALDSNKQIATAQGDAAQANLKAAKLLAEIQPRDLTTEELHDIEGMRRFAGHNLLISSLLFDSEGARLAKQLKSSLNRAGIGAGSTFETETWDKIGGYPEIITGLYGGSATGTVLRSGVGIWGTDRAAVAALQRTLSKYLKDVSAPPDSDNPFANSPQRLDSQFALIVFVGSKPIPQE
jgi:hypothetical protein